MQQDALFPLDAITGTGRPYPWPTAQAEPEPETPAENPDQLAFDDESGEAA